MKPPLATNAWLTLVLIAACAVAPGAHGATVGDGLELTIPVPPTPVRVEGHWQLDYEVLLANRSGKRITLEDFVVREARELFARRAGTARRCSRDDSGGQCPPYCQVTDRDAPESR